MTTPMQWHAMRIMQLHKEAEKGPTGTWLERWIPGWCEHKAVRCTHGDEIINRKFRRRVCLACGRALRGPLPEFCFFSPTGKKHSLYAKSGTVKR